MPFSAVMACSKQTKIAFTAVLSLFIIFQETGASRRGNIVQGINTSVRYSLILEVGGSLSGRGDEGEISSKLFQCY
jgi:hypothetical protein